MTLTVVEEVEAEAEQEAEAVDKTEAEAVDKTEDVRTASSEAEAMSERKQNWENI